MVVIEAIQRAFRELRRMPVLTRIGLTLALAAFVVDVLVHLSPAPHHHGGGFLPEEHLAHLAGLIAMFIALLGVVIDGVRRQRSHRRLAGAAGGSSHAHR